MRLSHLIQALKGAPLPRQGSGEGVAKQVPDGASRIGAKQHQQRW